MTKRCNYFLVLCFIFYAHIGWCDNLKTHMKIWTFGKISGAISKDKKWSYYLEPELRFLDDKYKFNEANLYAAFFYQVTPSFSAWIGAFAGNDLTSEGERRNFYSLWQQIKWLMFDNSKIRFMDRTRLEERKRSSFSQIAERIRQTFQLEIKLDTHDLFLVLADEMFLQLNHPRWVVDRVFSENRASVGVRIPINKCTSYEVGYLNQFQYEKNNNMSNILFMGFTVNTI